jgi:hypothetical protein
VKPHDRVSHDVDIALELLTLLISELGIAQIKVDTFSVPFSYGHWKSGSVFAVLYLLETDDDMHASSGRAREGQ